MNEMVERRIATVPGVLLMTPDDISVLAAIDIGCDRAIASSQKTEETCAICAKIAIERR
jgi:hypothetical protein